MGEMIRVELTLVMMTVIVILVALVLVLVLVLVTMRHPLLHVAAEAVMPAWRSTTSTLTAPQLTAASI